MEQTVQIATIGERHSRDEVLRFLQPASDPFGLTLVDEAEMVALTDGTATRLVADDGVRRLTFSSDGQLVGYLAFGPLVAALAATSALLPACLLQLGSLKDGPSHVWMRGIAPGAWQSLTAYGTVTRRLAVCARTLPAISDWPVSRDDVSVRSFVQGQDDAKVVGILTCAYANTPEGTWDAWQFAERLTYPWFRASDLLLVEDRSGSVLGLHWLKRRDAITGEVYNLAVDPAYGGRGLGALLLAKGLGHLTANGFTQVVLWVDAENVPANTLYTQAGFSVRAIDLQLALAKH